MLSSHPHFFVFQVAIYKRYSHRFVHYLFLQTYLCCPYTTKNIILNSYFILVLYFNFLFSFIYYYSLYSTTSAISDQGHSEITHWTNIAWWWPIRVETCSYKNIEWKNNVCKEWQDYQRTILTDILYAFLVSPS
jgi:hypothetical protein